MGYENESTGPSDRSERTRSRRLGGTPAGPRWRGAVRRLTALAVAAALMGACGEVGSPPAPGAAVPPVEAITDAVEGSAIAPAEKGPSRPLGTSPRRRDPDRFGDQGQQQAPACRAVCSNVGRRRG
jgi:hypothetical protein